MFSVNYRNRALKPSFISLPEKRLEAALPVPSVLKTGTNNVGAAVVAVRRAGSIHVFDTLNHFFFISQMIVPGSNYWNMGMGLEKGAVEKDEEGINTMKVLGENMAWLLKKIHG